MDDSDQPNKYTMDDSDQQVCTFFLKPSSKERNIRKRAVEHDEQGESSSSSVVYNNKKPPKNFSTGPTKQTTPDESTTSTTSTPDTSRFHFESSKQVQVHNDSKATATLETETDFSQDSRAIRERVLKQVENSLKGGQGQAKSSAGDEKIYKGIHGYTDYKAGFRREQTISGEKAGGAHGPLRASAHIRVSARFDYQPDICKDYKETGYCGFGDSCKFMHDRGDYKSGWQMEREWDEAEKVRKRNLAMGVVDEDAEDKDSDDEDGDEDSLPFACFICREPFVDPVVTKCKHYFCEHCALKHHSKSKKCFVCNQPTLGIFNTAHEIRKKMEAEGKK